MQQLISDIVKRVNDRGGLVLGVGIGLASPLSGPNADTFSSSLYPAWVDFQFGAILSRSLNVPLMFENDANLGAMGEFIWGRGETQNLAYIKLDSGIGSGHLVNGELMTGSEGLAGEIGHMFADPNAGTCYCGGYGCLVQVLGLDALQNHLTALGIDDAHGNTYLSLSDASVNPATKDQYRSLCETLSMALAKSLTGIISITNPQRIVLGGQGAHLPFLAELTEATLRRYLSDVTRPKVVIEVTPADKPTVALGGCALVRKHTSQLACFGLDGHSRTGLAS